MVDLSPGVSKINLAYFHFLFRITSSITFFAGVGLAYVALSRVKRLEDLAFSPMPSFDRLKNIENYALFKSRRREDHRIEEMERRTIALIEEQRMAKRMRANAEVHQVMEDLADLSFQLDDSDVEMEEV